MERAQPQKKKKVAPSQARQLWGERETALLIDLWEDRLMDLRRQKRNSGVYDDIAAALRQVGFERTRLQVHHKIENLAQTYRFWLKNQKTGAGAIPWTHFWRIHSFLGTLPANDPSRAQESQVTVEEVIMEMINGSDNGVVDNENRLQWEESAPIRPLDSPGPKSPSTCSPASSSPASPSPASPSPASPSPASSSLASSSLASSSPAISSATPASVTTTSRGPKKRKASDDFKQQILGEHILLREQLVASRQREYEQRERHMQMQEKFFNAMSKYLEKSSK
ncbi:uncharacterized protein LOC142576292 [Dermacentor variabilis]|uniref:uncharacterized protein LOC142576292 n=1 Tax=Dermacentor variabilis TaxID=34621 RepID=UPI003F5C6BE1